MISDSLSITPVIDPTTPDRHHDRIMGAAGAEDLALLRATWRAWFDCAPPASLRRMAGCILTAVAGPSAASSAAHKAIAQCAAHGWA